MKNKILVSLILALIFGVAIFVFALFTETKTIEKIENDTELLPSVKNFTENYRKWINFDNPSITCIPENKCNGTFTFSLRVDLKENITEIEKFLNNYGKTEVYGFDYYRIIFKTNKLNNIAPILNSSLFKGVNLVLIESDFKLESLGENLTYCKVDEDCIKSLSKGCNSEVNFINEKYEKETREYYNIKSWGKMCAAEYRPPGIRNSYKPVCMNNQCVGVFNESAMCDYLSNLLSYIIEKPSNEPYFSDSDLTNGDIKEICSNTSIT